MEAALLGWISTYGNVALFGLLVLGIVGAPVPDETLLIFAGVLVGRGTLNPIGTYGAAMGGAIVGVTVSYLIGRGVGLPVLERYGRYLHVAPGQLDRMRASFHRAGKWALTFGYFVPGVRHLTALVAGAAALEPPLFAGFAYSGACLWGATFVSLGWYLGDRGQAIARMLTHHGRVAALLLAATIALVWTVRRLRAR
jgi:membrane protein DedA with SNARE-associated domain